MRDTGLPVDVSHELARAVRSIRRVPSMLATDICSYDELAPH